MFKDSFFKKVEEKSGVNKNTILDLANKLQKSNMKDENVLKDVIHQISNITGREVSKEKEQKSQAQARETPRAFVYENLPLCH